jgi:Zn-dependent protease with chaperone function
MTGVQPPDRASQANRPWKPLGPVPTPGWVWLGLELLFVLGLLKLTEALAWPWGWTLALETLVVGLAIWQRDRLTRFGPLELRLVEALTALAFGAVVAVSLGPIEAGLVRLGLSIPLGPLWIVLAAATLASPWIWDGLLRWVWQAEPLPLVDLRENHPEMMSVIRRGLGSQASPILWLVPSPAPIALSYGLGRWTRLVLSQGSFDRLSPPELTAIVAGQVGQVQQRSVLLSLLTLVLLLPYGLYWQCSVWGNYWLAQTQKPGDSGLRGLRLVILWLCALGAALGYGLFKLWRWPLLGLSRSRLYWADRAAADLCGDANAYARALITMAQGQVKAMRRGQRLPGLLEGLELLLPIGPYLALSLSQMSPLQAVNADCAYLYRGPLTLNQAQPPLGDRLRWLNGYGARSGRKPDVALPKDDPSLRLNPWGLRQLPVSQRRSAVMAWLDRGRPLLFQGAPLVGALVGGLAVLLLWWLAGLGSYVGIAGLDPIFGDDQLLRGGIVVGVGLGLLVRTNRFFEPRSPHQVGTYDAALQDLLADVQATPLRSRSIDIQGKLVGRSGVSNWLGQDLMLDTGDRLIRLHWCSPLGPLGNLWPGFLRPSLLLGRSVTVTGWLRRGATIWIDVEQLRTDRGKTAQRGHPMWAAVMAGAIVLVGVGILLGWW